MGSDPRGLTPVPPRGSPSCADDPPAAAAGSQLQVCAGQTSVNAGKYPVKSFSLLVNNGDCSHSA
jgi:hypothetical protein